MQVLTALAIFFFLFSHKAFAYEWELTTLSKDLITSLETTHAGIYAGEQDTRSWLNPYRGVYLSKDLGKTWLPAGLEKRGVMDLSYDKLNKRLYAATHYSVFDETLNESVGGLFALENGLWKHMGPKVSTAAVFADEQVILLGTNAHGMWASYDQGRNWQQKLGSGYFGPKVRVITKIDNRVFLHDEFNVYYSDDNANTLTNVLPLRNEKVSDIEGVDSVVLAGTSNNRGLFRSTDKGVTWGKVVQFEGKIISKIVFYPITKSFFAFAKDTSSADIYQSTDNGLTWQPTGLQGASSVNSMDWIFTQPSLLFASVTNAGVYSAQINSPTNLLQAFDPPWLLNKSADLVDKISSFFDHEYPLLGYSYYPEPPEKSSTTTNYLGEELPEPLSYYSSHDGIDFALPFGTDITAVRSGMAQYGYESEGLGHYVTVRHDNGFATIYGHLQEFPAKVFTTPKLVTNREIIGKVGMSGNTTGPHVHLTTVQDLDNDMTFENDIPQGKTDPFGWQNLNEPDPWESYTWTDSLGTHKTNKNYYLWNTPQAITAVYSGITAMATFNNISVNFLEDTPPMTVILKQVPTGISYILDANKLQIPFGSINIKLMDNFGQIVAQTPDPLEIKINYTADIVRNVVEQSLKIYHLNNTTNSWEELDSVSDNETNTVTASINSFSTFALFGDKIDTNPPQTKIKISGLQLNNKYISQVQIELDSQDIDYQSEVLHTFYKLNQGDWMKYEELLNIEDSGDYILKFKSLDEFGNMEQEQQMTFTIDKTLVKNKITIKSAGFSTVMQ